MAELRSLIVVLGDQLDLDAAAFDGFDAAADTVWMAEVAEESTHVWSSKPRSVMFLAAMRHFALALQAAAHPLPEPSISSSMREAEPRRCFRDHPAGIDDPALRPGVDQWPSSGVSCRGAAVRARARSRR